MAKLKTKQKVALIVTAGVIGTVLVYGFILYMYIFYTNWGAMYNAYAESDDYEYFNMTVQDVRIDEERNVAYIYIDTVDADDFFSRYAEKYSVDSWIDGSAPYTGEYLQVQGKTYLTLIETNFFERIADDGVVVTVYSHPYYWWDSWDYPLLGASIGDQEYISFEMGKQNWLDWLKSNYEDYGFLQTPIKEQ